MKKYIIPILIVVGVVGYGLAAVLGVTVRTRSQAHVEQLQNMAAQVGSLTADRNSLQIELRSANEALETAQADLSILQIDFDDLTANYADQTNELRSLNSEIIRLRASVNSVICTVDPLTNVNYSSNSTVSTALEAWMESHLDITITGTSFEKVWINSDTAIHRLYGGGYAYIFLVYFDEPSLRHNDSVFWIDGQCFLDR